MYEAYPNLKSYFNALNIYMLGDLLVFDKNCDQADKSDFYHRTTISGRTILELHPNLDIPVPFSSVYPSDTGSHPSLAYIQNPNPRLAIPLALTLFSVIELLGILYTGRTDAGSTTKNINTFFEKLDPSDRPSDEDIKSLIKIYRHGLVHQYFAKNGGLLSYNHIGPDKLFFTYETTCLNVNYLKKLFLAGFKKIQNDEASFSLMEANIIKLNQSTQK